MTAEELLSIVNEGLKKTLTKKDIFTNDIELNHLKRIDKIFNKGLHYYLDPNTPEINKEASIFFRKEKFGTDLNIGAKKIVNLYEEKKIYLSSISKLTEFNIERVLPTYNINHNPKNAAELLRKELYPKFTEIKKDFLKSLIEKFSDYNILVFEFVETWNKIEKANIDGVFIVPNTIVLKRQQTSFRREIFTLIHELGHYLLNEEEIEEVDFFNFENMKLNLIERWCNDFAYHFLIGNYDIEIEQIAHANKKNDYYYQKIEEISDKTHLSKLALYTHLLYRNKISQVDYNTIRNEFDEKYKKKLEEEKKQKEFKKLNGEKQKGSAPKPINSPLLISTLQAAYYDGIINEYDFCKELNIPLKELNSYIQ